MLCAIHEKRPSTPAEYEASTLTFLRDAVGACRKLEPELAVALFLELLADNEIREIGFKRVAEMQAEERRAHRASAPRPHPVAQNRNSRRDADGRHQTQTPHPQAPAVVDEDDVELIFEDVTEEIE
jgi:hypothetical protein